MTGVQGEEEGNGRKKRRILLTLIGIVGPVFLFGILIYLFPHIFYDKFLYKYYIKSFLEDGSYNPVDTTTYGLMIAAAIFGLHRLLSRLNIRVDRRAIFVILPWALIGGTLRSLEDSEFFHEPLKYLFISPAIYFVIAITVLLIVLSSTAFQVYSKREERWKEGLLLSLGLLVFFDILYAFVYFSKTGLVSYLFTPVYPIILTVVLAYPLYADARRRGYADMKTNVLITGIYFFFLTVLPIAVWPNAAGWKEHYISLGHRTSGLLWGSFLNIILLTLVSTALIYAIFRGLRKRYSKACYFTTPLALLIVFSHFLDASATSVGIELHGYVEKHVVPHFLFELTGSAYSMFLLKLPLVLLVIYLLDIAYREEFRENPDLLNLVKMGIIILGLAPGTRDALRMAMGV